MDPNARSRRNSLRRLWWKRSILPVVVGERGAVWRCEIPFSRQILSNSTSTGWGPNRRLPDTPTLDTHARVERVDDASPEDVPRDRRRGDEQAPRGCGSAGLARNGLAEEQPEA
jgi:hypothetical protein